MIKVLGIKRIVGILSLLLLSGVVGALLFMYILPEREKLDRDLRILSASIASGRAEIDQLKQDIAFFEEQKYLFGNLVSLGFFTEQDRFYAQKRIEAIQDKSNILQMYYNFTPARVEENIHAAEANHVVLTTTVDVNVEAIDDLDFYRFMYWVNNAFSGQTSINSFNLERVADVDDYTLRQIGSGTPVTLLKGNITFDWRTLIPRENFVSEEVPF
jgi:hypothetical protein